MSGTAALCIEILSFEGCPNAAIARDRTSGALEAEHIIAQIEGIDVPTDDLAKKIRFLGSPSVRVNGKDVETEAEARRDYALMCRTYISNGRMEGAPSVDLIRAAIRRAASKHGSDRR